MTEKLHLQTDYTIEGVPVTLEKKYKRNTRATDEDRARTVALYVATGSVTDVSELTGFSRQIIHRWMQEPWWPVLLDKVKKEHNDRLDAGISKVINLSVDQLEDRVQNGDSHLAKDGQIVRVPVKARDLAGTIGTLFDRRQLIRGEATSVTTSTDPTARLQTLFDKFQKFATAKEVIQESPSEVSEEVTDV